MSSWTGSYSFILAAGVGAAIIGYIVIQKRKTNAQQSPTKTDSTENSCSLPENVSESCEEAVSIAREAIPAVAEYADPSSSEAAVQLPGRDSSKSPDRENLKGRAQTVTSDIQDTLTDAATRTGEVVTDAASKACNKTVNVLATTTEQTKELAAATKESTSKVIGELSSDISKVADRVQPVTENVKSYVENVVDHATATLTSAIVQDDAVVSPPNASETFTKSAEGEMQDGKDSQLSLPEDLKSTDSFVHLGKDEAAY